MKALNLLPKIPFSQKYFRILMGTIAALTVLGLSGLTALYVHMAESADRNAALADQLQIRRTVLMKERTMDARTALYRTFRADVVRLQEVNKDWLPVFQTVTSQLPAAARINRMAAGPEGRINLQLDMRNMEDAAGYIVLLQESSRFEKVAVNRILRQELKQPAAAAGAAGAAGSGGTGEVPSSGVGITANPYLKKLQEAADRPKITETEQLMGEIDWMINRQLGKQLYGVELPNQTPAPSSAPGPGGGIIGKDLEEARKSLDELKKLKAMPAGQQTAAGAGNPRTDQAAEQAGTEKLTVELELWCKP